MWPIIQELNVDLKEEVNFLKKTYKLKDKQCLVGEMCWLSVDPKYQGRGIAKHLSRLLHEQFVNKGFWICKAECSGAFSAKTMQKIGAVKEHEVDYASYVIKGGCCSKDKMPFKDSVVEPHKAFTFQVIRHFPEGKDKDAWKKHKEAKAAKK